MKVGISGMKDKIITLFKSKFLGAFLAISGGSVIAQGINFLFQPIVTRLYSVEEFGEYAIYTSVLAVVSVIISLAYDQAVIAVTNEEEAQQLMFGTVYVSGILSVFFAAFCVFFRSRVLSWMELETCDWFYILPVNLFMLSTYNLIISYNYRLGKYRSLGVSACIRSAGMGLMQILLFYAGMSSVGLSFSRVVALFLSSILIFLNMIKAGILKENASIPLVWKSFKRNYQFPAFQLPASFVNHFLDTTITFAILSLFTRKELGMYSIVVQILAMPISLLSTSLRQLCISEFNKRHRDLSASRKLYLQIAFGMSALIVLGMGILYMWGEPIFVFIFGKKWAGAGIYIRGLALLYAVRFVAYPLSSVAIVEKKQNVFLIFQISLIVSSFVAFSISKIFSFSIYKYLFVLSAALSLVYILQSFVFYKILINKCREEVVDND